MFGPRIVRSPTLPRGIVLLAPVKLLTDADIEAMAVNPEIGALSVRSYERYGKGRRPARLNFADCLSYAFAKAHDAWLLYKRDDVFQRDVNTPA
jgi:ribonuclease VapC